MKYFAAVDDHTYEIDIDHHGRITVDGTEMAADMHLVAGESLYSLLLENRSYEVVLHPETEKRNFYGVMVSGLLHRVKVQDERSRRLALVDRNLRAPEGELAVRAPIPGLVVKIAVEPGQVVAEGQTLVILEAMKMENELAAPRDGTVIEVRVEPGAQVATGKVLITIR